MIKKEKNYHTCSCGHRHCVDKREIALFTGMVISLSKIYKWCVEKNKHEFQRKEINNLLTDGNKSARFGDWIYFGGLVYRPKGGLKGTWGLNLDRCQKFFSGQSVIASKVLKNPITGEIEKFDFRHVTQMPKVYEFLDKNGLYNANYVPQGLFKIGEENNDDGDVTNNIIDL